MRLARGPGAGGGILLLLAAAVPVLPNYYVELLTEGLILALLAMSLDLLVGFVGLESLGHGAFFGAACYSTILLGAAGYENFWLCLVVALALAGAIAGAFGLVALRTRGPYFLIITLALSYLLGGLATRWRSLTGGDEGLAVALRPELGFHWSVGSTLGIFFLTEASVAVCGGFLFVVAGSSFGHALRGIKDDEERMRALGYNTWAYKYVAFVLSALVAAVPGLLFAYHNGFVSPYELSIYRSAEGLIAVILGGAGTLLGPAVGAAIIFLLRSLSAGFTEHWATVLGLLYVGVVLLLPGGLISLLAPAPRRRR